LASAAIAAPAYAQLEFGKPCDRPWDCGTLTVPLDRSGAVPGSLDLHVERIAVEDPQGVLVALAGGPGQPSADLSLMEGFNRELAPGLRTRDLVAMDRRGTGRSGAINCRALQRAEIAKAADEAAACAEQLGARRTLYTTEHAVADLEDLRVALGVERLTIYGVSYGVQHALAYAATHPARVERLVLDSVLVPSGPDPFYRSSFQAVPRVLRALCRGGRCFGMSPARDLAALVERIAGRPMHGFAYDGRGRRHRVEITREDLFDQLKFGDLFAAARGDLPAAYRMALRGDPALLARLHYRPPSADDEASFRVRDYSQGLFAAATCEETALPWERSTPIDERMDVARGAAALLPGSAFGPFDAETALATDVIGLCRKWPTAGEAPAMPTGPFPDVPVLILNGENDVRTPLSAAEQVAAAFPRSTLVTDRVGHSVLFSSKCARAGVRAFFRDREPGSCKRARLVPVRDLPPGRGEGVLEGVMATLGDIALRFATDLGGRFAGPMRAGGLRGGWLRAGPEKTRLRDYVYVRRLPVSGTLRVGPRGVLEGEFSVGRRARLVLDGGRLKGDVDGQPVDVPFRLKEPRP
jgi:pimeloyl-ACP methyl ester carboxylesterase